MNPEHIGPGVFPPAQCYEAQLTTLKKLVRESARLIISVKTDTPCPFCDWEPDWKSIDPQIHPDECPAQLILARPEVQELLEEK